MKQHQRQSQYHHGVRPQTHLTLAVFTAIAAGLFNALMGAVVKYGSQGVTVEAMTFWRNLVCLVLVLPWLMYTPPRHMTIAERLQPKRNLPMHLIRSLSGLAAIYLFYISLQFLSLSDATLLANTIPIFVPITGYFWKKIPVIHKLWWGLGIAFAGIILIIQPDLGVFNPASFIGLAGAVCGSVAVLALRFSHYNEPPVRTLFFYFLIGSIVSVLGTLPRFSLNWLNLTKEGMLILLVLGLLAICYQLCFTYAAKWAPIRLSSPFLFTSVIFSMILQKFVWDTPVPPSSILGFVLTTIGAILVVALYPKHLR